MSTEMSWLRADYASEELVRRSSSGRWCLGRQSKSSRLRFLEACPGIPIRTVPAEPACYIPAHDNRATNLDMECPSCLPPKGQPMPCAQKLFQSREEDLRITKGPQAADAWRRPSRSYLLTSFVMRGVLVLSSSLTRRGMPRWLRRPVKGEGQCFGDKRLELFFNFELFFNLQTKFSRLPG
uniref:Uncharacterized protein n=1 Tax=Cannabis sativa TaxID=3483 RepID=A0A803NSX4_CANSA